MRCLGSTFGHNQEARHTAVFTEWGRVADAFDLSELHSEPTFSWGGGLRGFVNQMIVRVDFGVSDEDALFQMAVNHPF